MNALLPLMTMTLMFLLSCGEPKVNKEFPPDEPNEDKPTFEVVKSDLLYSSEGGEGVIIVNSDNREIEVNLDCKWVNYILREQVIYLYVFVNESGRVRTTDFIISCEGDEIRLQLTQLATTIEISPTTIEIDSSGGNVMVCVETDEDYTLTTEHRWVQCTPDDRCFYLSINENTASDSRLTYITVSITDYPDTYVYVTQKGLASTSEVIEGEWTLSSSDMRGKPNPDKTIELSSQSGDGYNMTGLEYPVVIGRSNEGFSIKSGQKVGTTEDLNVFLCGYDREYRAYNYSESGLWGKLSISDMEYKIEFKDDGDWNYFSADGFIFWVFNGDEPTQENQVGAFAEALRYFDIVLTKNKK